MIVTKTMFTANASIRILRVVARLPAKMDVMSFLLLFGVGLETMEDVIVESEKTSATEDLGVELKETGAMEDVEAEPGILLGSK